MTKKEPKPRIKKDGGPGRIPNKDKVGETYKVLAERNPAMAAKNTESLAALAQGFFKKEKHKKKQKSKVSLAER